MSSNIIKALGDNAKFYPNYLTNYVASDFKFHLDNGIGKLLSEKDRLHQENAELREMLNKHKQFNEDMHVMDSSWTIKKSIELHKQTFELLNKNDQTS